MSALPPHPSPPVTPQDIHNFLRFDTDDDDADTASQRSISLSSPATSARNSTLSQHESPFGEPTSFLKRESHPYTIGTDGSSDADNLSMYTHETGIQESPSTSAEPSLYEQAKEVKPTPLPTYPPPSLNRGDNVSVSSHTSGSSRKARPESLLLIPPDSPIVLGIALVDFNHLVGPRIEYSTGSLLEDEEIAKILPFLALPDGAHLSAEDFSYFHIVPTGPNPTTVFGISCNQQIAASALLVKSPDVTRSTVQKAVVVLASKPVFGPIRDKLGVVTTALFNQRDFTETAILDDFGSSLELSLRSQLTESGLYMGTSLRELVHTFRQRTLVLVKALMLQKRIMFFGHPVERLCTYQYSLISLLPGLLQTLDDCGSPPLASRAPTLTRPTSLRTSDRKSMMAYMGLPLDVFGKDAFFQPYLPLQQLDMIKETKSWLCGCTNTIVTQQKEIDLLVNTETGVFEFRDPKLERSAGLTAADRKWMDDIVTDVNDGWDDEDPTRSTGIQFKGSDDYLRTKFEEYISAALASVRYRDFVAKGENSGVMITGGSGGDSSSTEDFNPLWISEFKGTNAYDVWERTTDPLLFDIVEPRHPCNEKPSVVADIGLRLQEGIQELKLEQQLAPAREAVARTLTVGSTNFFKAVEGVRGRWAQRTPSTSTPAPATDESNGSRSSTPPVEISKAEIESSPSPGPSPQPKHLSVGATPATPARPGLSSWGVGLGSFISTRASRFSLGRPQQPDAAPAPAPASVTEPHVDPSSSQNPSSQRPPSLPSPVTLPSSLVQDPGRTPTALPSPQILVASPVEISMTNHAPAPRSPSPPGPSNTNPHMDTYEDDHVEHVVPAGMAL